ncbi:recombination mediator RecR [Candidatus Synchoanobacter obligatus]|uniref:Recombination protein RecR n=1 Tax=Candidatus Synchoanobacter obligatus TaxID=2919597 RepID=A0ABT1L4Q3_9GAMM|nr:recombination mediator RecR [Candidatus Synchoanobacter obligatus]MCP8351936.1 recombination mediator RecR [Candidatus Synchoanobacter obligatus]
MTPLLQKLIHSFQFLPGIGEKTAQRFVHHIFGHQKHLAQGFAETLLEAIEKIKHCQRCQNLSEDDLCQICASSERDESILCIVEHPSNVSIFESTQSYDGKYFVLHGVLSPINGVGPQDLGIGKLDILLKQHPIKEVLIATSSKVEGEATAYYLYEYLNDKVAKITRPAHGLPIGGSLDYIDGQTLTRALRGRQEMVD